MADQRAGAESKVYGLFDRPVPSGGYAWWYVDAISEDGAYALTLIAFIGSVFSPYYAWSGRHDPLNHCALNVALYGRRGQRWTMTERGRNSVHIAANEFGIGPSCVRWDGDGLTVDIRETGMPIPFPVRGRVRLVPRMLNTRQFAIDAGDCHHWRPIAPFADVEVDFDSPRLSWRGQGYFDTNFGDGPLEDAFRYWDWSRMHEKNGTTTLSYTTDSRNGEQVGHALRFSRDGNLEAVRRQPAIELPSSPIFGIRRRAHPIAPYPIKLDSTLEDTPFYSRSTISSRIEGQQARGVHESLDGNRLRQTLVKMMLPFRMPRRA
ncbi:MAG: carotenoid 1,2-hydratase [Hyphomonas sp.]